MADERKEGMDIADGTSGWLVIFVGAVYILASLSLV
jgi:hypothetical protein